MKIIPNLLPLIFVSALTLPLNINAAQPRQVHTSAAESSVTDVRYWALIYDGEPNPYTEAGKLGIYELDPKLASTELKFAIADDNEFRYSTAWVENGVYYALYSQYANSQKLIAYNTATWTKIDNLCTTYSFPFVIEGVARNERDGKFYGQVYYTSSVKYFAWIDLRDGSYEIIGKMPNRNSNATFFDEEGNAYILIGDTVNSLDITTGETTQLFTSNYCYTCSAPLYSHVTGKYYVHTGLENYSIDLNTQKTETYRSFSNAMCPITGAVEKPIYADGVPAAPTVKAVSFANESLRGNISFTMPEATEDNSLSELKYTVYLNGEVIASEMSFYGETITLPVSVEQDGKYIFNVTATNEVGEGPMSVDYAYIGVEQPKAPQNVSAVYADGKITVSWDAVTEGIYGGAISADDVTYTVTRQSDNVVVAENIKDTSFVDEMAEPDELTIYYYDVVVNYKGYSNESTSNKVPVGNIQAPFSNSFDSDDSIFGYTIVDANKDGNTWYKNGGAVTIESNYTNSEYTIDNDDWFITPGIAMKAGNVYKISYDVKTFPYEASRYELCLGSSINPADMTTTIVEPTDILTDGYETTTVYYTSTVDQTAYIGWHNLNKESTYYFTLDNLNVEVYSAYSPGEVSDIDIVPDIKGALNATISFNAPTSNYMGDEAITEITKIEVLRNSELVKTFENLQPGEALSFTDEVDENGYYTYTFVPYNSYGLGRSVSKASYIGINIPGKVENLVATGTSSNGEVEIRWDAPEVDKDGYPINSSFVKYKVYRESTDENGDDNSTLLSDSSYRRYIYHPVADKTQEVCQYKVIAYTEKGEGEAAETNKVMIGTPYSLPYRDNFSNQGYPDNIYATYRISGKGSFGVVNKEDANGDGSYFRATSLFYDAVTMFETGQIAISGENPTLSFFAYYSNPTYIEETSVTVCVSEDFGNTFTDVQEFVIREDAKYEYDWNNFRCDLSAYKGKNVVIGFKALTCGTNLPIDAIYIGENSGKDVLLSTLTVPATTNSGEDFDLTVKVRNAGDKAINSAVVNVFRNDVVVDAQIVKLDVDEMATLTFTLNNSVNEDTTYKYYAIAHLSDDINTDNNKSTIAETTTLANSAVGSLSVDALSISVANQAIVIANADGQDIVVSSIDGKVIAHEVGASETRIDVAPGIYIVRVGNQTRKLAVK